MSHRSCSSAASWGSNVHHTYAITLWGSGNTRVHWALWESLHGCRIGAHNLAATIQQRGPSSIQFGSLLLSLGPGIQGAKITKGRYGIWDHSWSQVLEEQSTIPSPVVVFNTHLKTGEFFIWFEQQLWEREPFKNYSPLHYFPSLNWPPEAISSIGGNKATNKDVYLQLSGPNSRFGAAFSFW